MRSNYLIVLMACLFLQLSWGQKAKGDPNAIQGASSFNLIFDYSDVKVGKFKSEESFLADKMKKREKKKAGDGERFRKSWFADREERFEPKFIESFNKRFKDNECKVGRLEDAPYTIRVHTTWMYPGYNVGVVRRNAEITTTIYVYKTGNLDDVLLTLNYKKVQGAGAMGHDYDSGYRLSECYAKLAKEFAKYVKKKITK